MFLDSGIRELFGMMSGFNFKEPILDQGGGNNSKPEDPNLIVDGTASGGGRQDSPEDAEIFSDIALTYISKMLMEEDIVFPERAALQAAEKPFYDILGEKYPPEERSGTGPSRHGQSKRGTDLELDWERNAKQTALSGGDEEVQSEMLDLLRGSDDAVASLREAFQSEASRNNSAAPSRSGRKTKKKKAAKKEMVDLRTLLVHCAQAVAADDRRAAGELLIQIRRHSSPGGDGSQRLAHWFAEGLEARLVGAGIQTAARQPAAAMLKAYHLYLAACPFKRVSHFFANQTILKAAEKASRLHIVDFGIYFGFQWPGLIQRLAARPGGPPRVRITAIEVPQPGFRPNERIEETGRRLQEYAARLGVRLEYCPISARWEAIRARDLALDPDELLVVNCMYRFRNLVDETVVADSPRNRVLATIRAMNPAVFVQAVVNGAFGAPFFVTRFREALFHFSALFDMLDATVPREHPDRLLMEREMFGREAMNVIACEGPERVERPETYKQWQVRNLRAGFAQLPLDPDIVVRCRDKVRSVYDSNFVIDQDSNWLLQGWKGRILFAISTWKPLQPPPVRSNSLPSLCL
ncbi:scarecrow-like protein 9 [Wolffia australiana]